MRFPVAAMDGLLSLGAVLVVSLPMVAFVLAAWIPQRADLLGAVGSVLVVVFAGLWLFGRPSQLEVTDDALVLRFPMHTLVLPRSHITGVEVFEGRSFLREHSSPIRLAASALWGGFDRLWGPARAYEAYLSRRSDLVVVSLTGRRPLLLSPADPAGLARALTHQARPGSSPTRSA